MHGWVKVKPLASDASVLLQSRLWYLGRPRRHGGKIGTVADDGYRSVAVIEAAQHGKGLIAQLDGVQDRDAASALVGEQIAIPRSALPARVEGEYYWAELIGLVVVNRAGKALGRVSGLLESGANDILVVQDGGTERLLPLVGTVIDGIDLPACEIRVDWESDW